MIASNIKDPLPSWQYMPARYLFGVLNGSTPSSSEKSYWDGDIYWATPQDIGALKGKLILDTQRKITEEGYKNSGTQIAPVSSIVLTTRAPVGNLALAGVPLCTNQGCKVLVPKTAAVNSSYFYYQLLARKNELSSFATGTTFQELGTTELNSFELHFPSIFEQNRISDYLDCETQKIDALIGAKKRLLELLAEKRRSLITQAVTRGLKADVPMQYSGIEWLGEVPKHWDVPPIYTRYKLLLGKMLDEKKITGANLAPYLRNVDVQWHAINTKNLPQMDFDEIDRQTYALEVGDILICEGGESGRTAIWQGELQECFYQKALHRLRPMTDQDDPMFFSFVMEVAVRLGVFAAEGNRSTIQHLTAESLRVFRFPAPPYSEQVQIAEYVRSKLKVLDSLSLTTEKTINLLQERRTSLISAAVTGQIHIPN
jgi:type I restriction enzyme, S subunit